jgi:hypothetical protein
MPTLLLGIGVLVLVLWGLHVLKKADPRGVAKGLRAFGGVGAIGGAAFLALRGQYGLALPLGIAGLSLLGWMPGMPKAFGNRWNKSPGQISRVRTAFVEMELDHDTGAMEGRILAGPYEGSLLSALAVPTLVELMAQIDDESRALLAAYLDRRDPRWREHGDPNAAAGNGTAPGSGPMTQEEAYQILGVQPGTSPGEISRAHRNLMKKLHPDQGGSTYLAARVNQAKDVLLRKHK